MYHPYIKAIALLTLVTIVVAVALSLFWGVPYIFTFVGSATLVLGGHIVTLDDDLAGGWGNPDGEQSFPWAELLTKLAVLVVLGLLALVPGVRALGQ